MSALRRGRQAFPSLLLVVVVLVAGLAADGDGDSGRGPDDDSGDALREREYAEALALYRAGRFEQAVAVLLESIRADGGTAGRYALLGWCRLRTNRPGLAEEAFSAALAIEPEAVDPRVGRGFVALRLGRVSLAEQHFRQALARDPDASEAWKGLGLALQQSGEGAEARTALSRAVELAPFDDEARALLDDNLTRLVEERRPRPPLDPSEPLRVVSRAGRRRIEVPDGEGWRPLFVKGINLGTSLPGRFPAEFPDDEALYREWFDRIGELGANAVRLYTLHPPSLYRALDAHNRQRPAQRLWLIQGVWTELPPEDDFSNSGFEAGFRAEIRRVIDAVHGNLELPRRPGSAHGRYDADVSGQLLAYVLGREWEPFSVDAYNRRSPGRDRFEGSFVRAEAVLPIEAWLASVVETAVAHETGHYRTQHATAWVSWPTLDPLVHPTEATVAEEMAFRSAAAPGQEVEEIKEYDNDLVQVDATRVRATVAFPAGLFAAYHAYPYYPEFMILDPGYARARDEAGVSRYLGYLQELGRHHGDQPVLIAELGVPTSRGIAHLHPEGQHHGGHTPAEQDAIDARLMRNVHQAGLAGGVLFAWVDEWFKRNWLVMSYESPVERNPLWHNALDPEQNFGLLAARPGTSGWRIVLDGDVADWAGVSPLYERTSSEGPLRRFRAAVDEAYLYLLLESAEVAGASVDSLEHWIGIDTYDADRGEHRFPDIERRVAAGMEFLVRLAGRDEARLLVSRSYDLFSQRNRRPYASVASEDGDFVEIRIFTNRARFGRDGTRYPARGYSRSPLRHGSTDPAAPDHDALADYHVSADGRRVELRIAWGLLNVADPSSHRVIHEEQRTEGVVETAITPGFRFHLLTVQRTDRGAIAVVDSFPPPDTPLDAYPLHRWKAWDTPTYRLELKHTYPLLRQTLAAL